MNEDLSQSGVKLPAACPKWMPTLRWFGRYIFERWIDHQVKRTSLDRTLSYSASIVPKRQYFVERALRHFAQQET